MTTPALVTEVNGTLRTMRLRALDAVETEWLDVVLRELARRRLAREFCD